MVNPFSWQFKSFNMRAMSRLGLVATLAFAGFGTGLWATMHRSKTVVIQEDRHRDPPQPVVAPEALVPSDTDNEKDQDSLLPLGTDLREETITLPDDVVKIFALPRKTVKIQFHEAGPNIVALPVIMLCTPTVAFSDGTTKDLLTWLETGQKENDKAVPTVIQCEFVDTQKSPELLESVSAAIKTKLTSTKPLLFTPTSEFSVELCLNNMSGECVNLSTSAIKRGDSRPSVQFKLDSNAAQALVGSSPRLLMVGFQFSALAKSSKVDWQISATAVSRALTVIRNRVCNSPNATRTPILEVPGGRHKQQSSISRALGTAINIEIERNPAAHTPPMEVQQAAIQGAIAYCMRSREIFTESEERVMVVLQSGAVLEGGLRAVGQQARRMAKMSAAERANLFEKGESSTTQGMAGLKILGGILGLGRETATHTKEMFANSSQELSELAEMLDSGALQVTELDLNIQRDGDAGNSDQYQTRFISSKKLMHNYGFEMSCGQLLDDRMIAAAEVEKTKAEQEAQKLQDDLNKVEHERIRHQKAEEAKSEREGRRVRDVRLCIDVHDDHKNRFGWMTAKVYCGDVLVGEQVLGKDTEWPEGTQHSFSIPLTTPVYRGEKRQGYVELHFSTDAGDEVVCKSKTYGITTSGNTPESVGQLHRYLRGQSFRACELDLN